MRFAWLLSALILASTLALLQHYALANLLYWYYPWFDTMMHFLGGLALASFGVALLAKRRAFIFLGAMFGIAVGWEFFELVINAEREANFVFDTSLDLLMDALGMTVTYIAARLSIWRYA